MATDADAIRELGFVSKLDALHPIQHYMYFPGVENGKAVAALLRSQGFEVEDRMGADDVNWLVLAKHFIVPDEASIAAARASLERLCEENNGEYDGWEAEVQR